MAFMGSNIYVSKAIAIEITFLMKDLNADF